MGPRQLAPPGNQGATVPAVSGLVSGESAAAGWSPLVIADATYPSVFQVRFGDGTISDVMNHARAVDTARLWAVTPPVRRKPSRAPSPLPPADVPTAPPSYVVVITVSPSTSADGRAYSSRGPLFDVEVGGRVPFLDGARRLVELGHDGKAVLAMHCRKDEGDIDGLARWIADVGLLHPVVLASDGKLIAGKRRIEACKLLGWEEIPVHVIPLKEIARGELAENVARKDFTPSEIGAMRRALEPLVKARR
jgi:hypothetical protein